MIVLVVFLILHVTRALAIEFKCTPFPLNKIQISCGEASCNRYRCYNRYSDCSAYNRNKLEIEFIKCASYQLPTAALNEIGYSNIYSLNIANHDGKILQFEVFSNLKHLRKLTADHNKLTGLSYNVFLYTDLNYLDLSWNEFSKIDDIGLSGAKNLETLNISNNNVREIYEKSFLHLNRLKVLDLSFNNLTELNVAAFGALVELEYLMLAHINISHIDFGSFSTLKNLVSLDLCGNHIQTIDIESQPIVFHHLKYINVSSNGMINMNGLQPTTVPELNFLDLRFNNLICSQLKTILDSFKINEMNLPSEEIADIQPEQAYRGLSCNSSPFDQGRVDFQCTSSNNIIFITCGNSYERWRTDKRGFYHEYFSNCTSFRETKYVKTQFQNCSMSDLPTEALVEIGTSRVSILDVSNLDGNALNATYFSTLSVLEKMTANHNQLFAFPKNMFVNTNLNYLDVAYNKFTKIETIGRSGASELKTLNISNNELIEINTTSFEGLERLEVLDLSFNNLTIIGDETFDFLAELNNLSLAHTHLIHIDFGLLSHLERLQSLDISHTTIRKVVIGVHSAIFKKLQKIDMAASEIMEIDGLTQTVFPSLIYLDLRSNRINCSHLESILSSFDLNQVVLKLSPGSTIKKGKSYRGIACGQFVKIKSKVPLIEQTTILQNEPSTSALSIERTENTSTLWYEKESTYSSTESNELSSVEYKTDKTDENETIMIEETTIITRATTPTSSINAHITGSVVGSLAVVNDHYKLGQIHETLHIMKIIISFLAITLILTIVYIILYGNKKSISNRLRDAYAIRFRQNLSNNDQKKSHILKQ